MPVSRLDVLYRKVLISKFFTKGWGSAEDLVKLYNFRQIISNRDSCYKLVPKDYPVEIISQQSYSGYDIIEGKLSTPLKQYLPTLLVPEIHEVFFQMVVPKKWPSKDFRPMCLHLAGTGDHYFWRRRNIMAKPLLQAGIGSVIIENPYYGLRKPKNQIRSSLHFVSDIFVMGGCLILECLTLLNWCERLGFGPLGISGISMGGHLASLAASSWPKPLVLVPCLLWSTASSVFTEGVMSECIDWDILQKQFFSNTIYSDILSKSCQIIDCPLLKPNKVYEESSFLQEKFNTITVSPYEVMNSLKDTVPLTFSNQMKIKPSHHRKRGLNVLKKALIFNSRHEVLNMRKRCEEAIWFMRGIMDEFTHLKNFSIPFDPSLIIAVCAKSDGYVPRVGVSKLEDIWPTATVKYIDSGHIGAYIWHQNLFRNSIIEGFERAKRVMEPPGPYFQN